MQVCDRWHGATYSACVRQHDRISSIGPSLWLERQLMPLGYGCCSSRCKLPGLAPKYVYTSCKLAVTAVLRLRRLDALSAAAMGLGLRRAFDDSMLPMIMIISMFQTLLSCDAHIPARKEHAVPYLQDHSMQGHDPNRQYMCSQRGGIRGSGDQGFLLPGGYTWDQNCPLKSGIGV